MGVEHSLIYLIPIFFAIALFYSTTGQGGGSAYLAFLVLFGVSYLKLPSIALACNLVGTAGVIYHFWRAGYFKARLSVPFVITSVPAAFLGGSLDVPEKTFKILLVCLLVTVAFISFFNKAHEHKVKTPSVAVAIVFGPLIGFALGLAGGIAGIGGGIFLFPVIVALRWGGAKEAAAASGLFTFANSVGGLVGHGVKGGVDWKFLLPLTAAVFIGSQIGAHLGAKKLSAGVIQKIFAVILLAVAVKMLAGIV